MKRESLLRKYPTGTRIRIGNKTYVRHSYLTHWLDEEHLPICMYDVTSATLELYEILAGTQHQILGN